MSGRATKRVRAGSATGRSSRGESDRKGFQEFPPSEPSLSSSYSQARIKPESETSQSLSGWTPQDHTPSLLPPGKMLLPPLPKSRADHSASSRTDKNRTSHACEKCRKAKAKCSGSQPCEKCRAENKECIYGDKKRDKERKEMERLQYRNQKFEQRNDQLVNALLNFASELSPNKRRELEVLVMSPGSGTDEDDDMATNNDSDTKLSEQPDFLMLGEENADAEVGSPGSLDVINEDTNRDEHTRAAGFMGKSSAVTWVQRAKMVATHDFEDERRVRRSTSPAANGSFSDSTYHAESGDFLTVNAGEVNALEWPPPSVAKALVDSYFDNIHVSFPILSKKDFYKRFETFPKDQISTDDQCWLAIANIVFAIGAKFAHLTNAEYRSDDRDYLVYYARASALGMDQRTLNQDPELQHTACLGLVGLYLLATDQLNRSWTVCGIAVRHAMALGLHVRSEAQDLSDMDKELRVRLWWSLYCLERLLDELTGRPSCISDRDISTPLPINVDESQFRRDCPLYQRPSRQSITSPTSKGKARLTAPQIPTPITSTTASVDPSMASTSPTGSPIYPAYTFPMARLPITSSTYFIYRTQLSIISHEILTQLYCAALVKSKWSEVQDTIRDIDSRLLQWKASLPEEFNFSNPSSYTDSFTLHRTGLSMFYNSSRMTLFRPCLCRFEGRIINESERSKTFDSNCAATCIESARNIIASLPSMSEPSKVYTITAWWNVVHYIVEAGSVLMLELAYRAEHLPSQAEEILADSKKAVLWLRAMSDQSIAARKSWEIFNSLLQRVAPKVGGETWNMPKTAPVPPGWRWNRFGTRSKRDSGEEYSNELISPSQQSYSGIPNRMDEWANQSTYDTHQSYSVPAPAGSEAYTTTNDMMPGFLIGHYPFNEIYGRYDQFGPVQTQNIYYPQGSMPNAYPNASTYRSTEEDSGDMVSRSANMAPQLVTLGQVQLQGEMSGYGEVGYSDPSAPGAPSDDYEMAGYRGWSDAPAGGQGGQYSGTGGHSHD